MWSIEEDYPQQESSALLSTLLIEDDNTIDDFTDDTQIFDYSDTTDINIDPTMNTLSAEFDDEMFEGEQKLDNLEENIHENIFKQELDNFGETFQQELTNLDETTVTNNLKGETLEKFDGFDRINDAKVSNQITGNNDDALEILKTVKEDYSSEDKKELTSNNNIPRSQDHEVEISRIDIDQSLVQGKNNDNAHNMIDKQHAKNPQTAKTKNPANDMFKNVQSTTTFTTNPTTIKVDNNINNIDDTTDYNDNVYIKTDNSMIIDIKSSSQAPITHSDDVDYNDYVINEINNDNLSNNNNNESEISSEKIEVAGGSTVDKNMMTLPDASYPPTVSPPSNMGMGKPSFGKNSFQTSNESENTNYNTYGTTNGVKSEDVTTPNNSDQIMPPALDAKPPLATIKNNAYADYETSSNGVVKADQNDNELYVDGSESRGRNSDILYSTIKSIVANQRKNNIVDSLYNWLSNSLVPSPNYNYKRTDVHQNFVDTATYSSIEDTSTNSDNHDRSHLNIIPEGQYVEKYPYPYNYMPMVPYLGYPVPFVPAQQNTPGYRHNSQNHNVLFPVLHVPYVYLVPVHAHVHGFPPHQHFQESHG